jgi:uncharacterized protein (DUF362 family)
MNEERNGIGKPGAVEDGVVAAAVDVVAVVDVVVPTAAGI